MLEKKKTENDKRVLALNSECVALNSDLSPSSHKLQNEGHDGSTPHVRSAISPYSVHP